MSKCWYCNNELTTGDNPKHFGICNKCYDEMFKSGDTIIRSFTNKIADLEAKLAEKDAELWKWSTQYARAYVVRQNDLIAEKVGLQQQLAEKDEEIEEVKNELNAKEKRIAELEKQLKNVIVPKYKTGDKVYGIIDTWAYTDVFPVEIRDTHLLYEVWDGEDTTRQHSTRIFATKEEAEAKLEELKGE